MLRSASTDKPLEFIRRITKPQTHPIDDGQTVTRQQQYSFTAIRHAVFVYSNVAIFCFRFEHTMQEELLSLIRNAPTSQSDDVDACVASSHDDTKPRSILTNALVKKVPRSACNCASRLPCTCALVFLFSFFFDFGFK